MGKKRTKVIENVFKLLKRVVLLIISVVTTVITFTVGKQRYQLRGFISSLALTELPCNWSPLSSDCIVSHELICSNHSSHQLSPLFL